MSRLRSHALLPALLACCLFQAAHAADNFSSVEERMSYKEFTALGLDKLSPEQLRGLNDWMRTHGTNAACAPAQSGVMPAPTPSAAQAAASNQSASVVSRIAGDFKGWQQGTVLTLENGQRWEVRDDEPLYTSGEHSPKVTLQPGLLSGWTLGVEGHSEIAHVIPASAH